MKVLSLFDGMSCGQQALEQAGILVDTYYASEIDKYAIQITQKNYPNTIQLGDVTKWREWNLGEIDMIIGGSPCQDLSIAGKRAGLDGARSGLFWDMVDIIAHYKPKYFLLENVASMSKENKAIITEAMGVEPILINSALLTAQNRKRLYWTNIPGITQPEDKGIVIKNILEDEVDESFYLNNESILKAIENIKPKTFKTGKRRGPMPMVRSEKALTLLTSNCGENRLANRIIQLNNPDHSNNRVYGEEGKSPTPNTMQGGHRQPKILRGRPIMPYEPGHRTLDYKEYTEKCPTITINCAGGDQKNIVMTDRIRKLTPIECERLQGVRDGYTEGVSNSQRYKMIGNGRTVPVISHIFSYLSKVK